MNEMMKFNKNLISVGIALIAIVMLTGQSAVTAQTHDSTTWEGSFEADALAPVWDGTQPSWHSVSASGTVTADGGNNYINYPATGALGGTRNLNFVANAHTNGGASFEVRARWNSGSDGGLPIFGHIFTSAEPNDAHGGGSYYHWLTYYVNDGEIIINNSNNFANDNATVSVDTSVFRTYRFTHDGDEWNLYFNDDPTVQATLEHHPDAGEGIPYNGQFAFYVGYGGSNGDLDYMRYTDADAFVPGGGLPQICTPGCAANPNPGDVTADSSTWEAGCYEADNKFGESGPCWNEIGGHDAIATIVADGPGNNYISAVSTTPIQGAQTLNYVMDADTNGGASYEFRLRVNSGTLLMHASTTTDQSSHHYHWLTTYISTTNITLVNSNNFALGSVVGNTNTDWHSYRLTMDGTTWRLYMDGDPTPVLTLASPDNSDEGTPYDGHLALYWGDSAGVSADLDYLRWTDQGALVPTGAGGGCGSAGTVFDPADFNFDCYVNLKDYQIFAEQFMSCTDPANPACI